MELLQALEQPHKYAVTFKNGEAHLARIDEIKATGGKIIDRSILRNGLRSKPESNR